MAAGRLHIFELGRDKGRYGATVPAYQVNYNDAGNSFTGVMAEEKLRDFLSSRAALNPEALDRILGELHSSGRPSLADIEMSESAAGEIGLMQEPSDA